MVDQYVVPLPEGWGVRGATSRNVSQIFETKEQAIAFARSKAEEQHGALMIQQKDGKVIKEEDYHRESNPVEIKSVMVGNEYTSRLDEE